MCALARAAGAAIEVERRAAGGPAALADKDDGSPLTRADLAAHHILLAGLQALRPEWPVISEEGRLPEPPLPSAAMFWLVDPLDGTREFLAGRSEYTVNIALVSAGQAQLGVVLVPGSGTLYVGGAGWGAWREQADGQRTALRVAAPPAAGEAWRVVASRSHLDPATQGFIDRLGRVECLAVGSSLKFCRVAEGLAHVYPRFGPTHAWDTAAAQAVLEGAGGRVLVAGGSALRYPRPGVRNPAFVACCAALPPGLFG